MASKPRRLTVCVVAAVALTLTACSQDRAQPPAAPGPLPPPPLGMPVVVRLEIGAPGEIEPGASVQLTATAVKSDGSREDVTTQSIWSALGISPVQVVRTTGVATATHRGEATVQANFSGRTATARIFALPKGTFALKGIVTEQGIGIPDVRVEVVSGVGQGLVIAKTAFDGSYAFYGVAGAVGLHMKKVGYSNGIHQVNVAEHLTRDFELAADRARNDYSGSYTLTITADGSDCSPEFPQEARQRAYTATVAQQGPRVAVRLSDADLVVVNGHGSEFLGLADMTNQIRFMVGDAIWYHYGFSDYGGAFNIAERVSGRAVMFTGVANTTATASRISGRLDGAIIIGVRPVPPFNAVSGCWWGAHQFDMVRR